MAANILDAEIRKFLPLLGNDDKLSLLNKIKSLLHIREVLNTTPTPPSDLSTIDYSKYNFPVSSIKFDRGEINER